MTEIITGYCDHLVIAEHPYGHVFIGSVGIEQARWEAQKQVSDGARDAYVVPVVFHARMQTAIENDGDEEGIDEE